jgi:hypothetical protein
MVAFNKGGVNVQVALDHITAAVVKQCQKQ